MPISRIVLAAVAVGLIPAAAQTPPDAEGRILFESRLRSETVDQQGIAEQAHALTLRTRLGWRSPTAYGLQWLVEGEGGAVLDDRYSAPVDPVPGRPAIADGETLELNRAQLRWTGLPDTEITVGRQRLSVGNSRFVGNSGWRQNEQTFDAVRLATTVLKPVPDLGVEPTGSSGRSAMSTPRAPGAATSICCRSRRTRRSAG